jgi:hypothetical protein
MARSAPYRSRPELFPTGKLRMRLPVAAKMALIRAGTIGGTPGSRHPALPNFEENSL